LRFSAYPEVLIKALIYSETGEPKSVLQLADTPTPPLAPGEALVRVLLSPIHASDLHMVRGRYGYQPELPASPGIEGVGIVEAVGPGRTSKRQSAWPMVKLDSRRSCWTSPKGQHNQCSLIAFVTNQAVAFDKSMLGACRVCSVRINLCHVFCTRLNLEVFLLKVSYDTLVLVSHRRE
jgi:D-arabinose 1-dehydrogenase-like Zn-dependent alcohol dehydrogenase